MGQLTISMAMFNSFLYVYQRVISSDKSSLHAQSESIFIAKLVDIAPISVGFMDIYGRIYIMGLISSHLWSSGPAYRDPQ